MHTVEIISFLVIGYAAGAATFAPLWVKAKKEADIAAGCFHHLYEAVQTDVKKAEDYVKQVEARVKELL